MEARFHQLQTLDQLSGRPRSLREAEEAGKETTTRRQQQCLTVKFFLYRAIVLATVRAREAVHAGTSDLVVMVKKKKKTGQGVVFFLIYYRN